MQEDVIAIGGLAATFIFFVVLYRLVQFAQRKVFGAILQKFQTLRQMPKEAVRANEFDYGPNVHLRGGVEVAEQGDQLLLKLALLPTLSIPVNSLSSVKISEGAFRTKLFEIEFQEKLPTLKIGVKSDLLGQFPNLVRLAQAGQPSTSSQNAMPVAQNVPMTLQIKVDPFLKNKVGNFVRALIFVALLVAAAIAFQYL